MTSPEGTHGPDNDASLSARYEAIIAELRAQNAAYFTASVDSVDANTKFAESMGLKYPILSDETKDVARAYGVLSASGFASRWTFYIGADGRVQEIDKQVSAASHGADVVARLAALGNRT